MESSGDTDEQNVLGLPHTFEQRLQHLKRRLVRESAQAIGMLEGALAALWTLDVEAARSVRNQDDKVDTEEVNIEREAHSLLALHHAFARDFRAINFILKVNADIERVADHAASIAKITVRIAKHLGDGDILATDPPQWPTALRELGDRVATTRQQLFGGVSESQRLRLNPPHCRHRNCGEIAVLTPTFGKGRDPRRNLLRAHCAAHARSGGSLQHG